MAMGLQPRVPKWPVVRRSILGFAWLGLAVWGPGAQGNDSYQVSGYVQSWAKHEWVENGKINPDTGEKAAQQASGFFLNRIRLGGVASLSDSFLICSISTRLERQPSLLDCYLELRFTPLLAVRVGQMKIPLTRETLQSPADNDFINRSQVSNVLADWSLARTPYIGSFQHIKSYHRDTGISLLGKVCGQWLSYQGMVGNGFGANRYVGGYEKYEPGDLFGNQAGDFFYGLRLVTRLFNLAEAGGCVTRNVHTNYIKNELRYAEVNNIDRYSYAADLHWAEIKPLQIDLLFAQGSIRDQKTITGKDDLDYGGWAGSILARPIWHGIGGGLRYDRYYYEYNDDGHVYNDDQFTIGLNYFRGEVLKLQLNYIYKAYDNQYRRNLKDDILAVNIQYAFTHTSSR